MASEYDDEGHLCSWDRVQRCGRASSGRRATWPRLLHTWVGDYADCTLRRREEEEG